VIPAPIRRLALSLGPQYGRHEFRGTIATLLGLEAAMIIGAHVMLESMAEAADKAFLTDILKLSSVDAGGGFLIFGLPPTEVAVHESDRNDAHELYLMCEDIEAFVEQMERHGISATPPENQGWGTLTRVVLPGGGKLAVYEPHHARPHKAIAHRPAKKKAPKARPKAKPTARKPAKKEATKKATKKAARAKQR